MEKYARYNHGQCTRTIYYLPVAVPGMRRYILFLMLSTVLMTAPARIGARAGSEMIIHPAGATHEGNYVHLVGGSIQINGTVTGDVVAIAEEVTIRGTIEGDAIIVAERVVVGGVVKGNVRAAADRLRIEGIVGRNVTVLARKLELAKTAEVGIDVWAAAQDAAIGGRVSRAADVRARTIALAGAIGGPAKMTADAAFTVAPGASVAGALIYSAPQPIPSGNEKIAPEVTYRPPQEQGRERSLFWPLVFLFGAWVVGAVGLTIAGPLFEKFAEAVQGKFWKVMGWGAVGMIVPLVAAVALAMTLIGIPLAVLLIVAYGVMMYASTIIAGYAVASVLARRFQWQFPNIIVMMVGVALFSIAGIVPYTALAAQLFGALVSFGVVINVIASGRSA